MPKNVVCLRYLLLGLTIVLGISGIAVTVGAGIFLYQLNQFGSLNAENVVGPATILIVAGLASCVLGWCGCQVMDYTKRAQVVLFSVFVASITIAEGTAGIWALIRHEELQVPSPVVLQKSLAKSLTQEKALWDYIQLKLHCCGIKGPDDYYAIQDGIPRTCFEGSTPEKTAFNVGCPYAVVSRTRSVLLHIFLLALGSVLLQIVCIICGSCYVRAVKDAIRKRTQKAIAAASAPPSAGTSRKVSDPESLLRHKMSPK